MRQARVARFDCAFRWRWWGMLERPLTPLEREGEGEMPDTVSKIEGLMLLIYLYFQYKCTDWMDTVCGHVLY